MKRHSITKKELGSIHERQLQKQLHALFFDGTYSTKSLSGKIIHIIHAGRINPYSGPDFLDMAMLIQGELLIGKGEFHRYASDWFAHKHHLDPHYNDVLLHIVCEQDVTVSIAQESIIIPHEQIISTRIIEQSIALHSMDDLQDYAFRRLMRRCKEIQLLEYSIQNPAEQLQAYCMVFLRKRMHLRRRNITKEDNCFAVIHMFTHSPMILAIMQGADIPNDITNISLNARNGISTHLFCELFLNAFFPFLIHINTSHAYSSIEWYWIQKSITRYDSLIRRFPDIPQQYMWQQQGILEYMRTDHAIQDSCHEYYIPYIDTKLDIQ